MASKQWEQTENKQTNNVTKDTGEQKESKQKARRWQKKQWDQKGDKQNKQRKATCGKQRQGEQK